VVQDLQAIRMEHPLLGDEAVEPILTPTNSGRGLSSLATLDWRQSLGGVLILAGFVAVIAGWWGVSGTTSTSSQLAYMVSGGLGGIGLVFVGGVFLVAFEHATDRMAMAQVDARLRHLEQCLAGEFDSLNDVLRQGETAAPNGTSRRSRVSARGGR